MRDEIAKFENAGIRPFGVNPAGVDSHRKYVELFRFPFPLLSDPAREIAGAYRALKDDGKGIQRTVYVIGRDGHVKFGQRGAPPPDEVVSAVGPPPPARGR